MLSKYVVVDMWRRSFADYLSDLGQVVERSVYFGFDRPAEIARFGDLADEALCVSDLGVFWTLGFLSDAFER